MTISISLYFSILILITVSYFIGPYHFNLCSLVLSLCFSEPNRNEYSYRLNLSEFHDKFFLGSRNKIVSHGMKILIYNGILIKLHRVIIKFKKNQHFLLISLSLVSLLKIMKCTYRFIVHTSLGCMIIWPQWWNIIAYSVSSSSRLFCFQLCSFHS